MKPPTPGRFSPRGGVAYLLTMLYLMLFTALAIGFAAASSVAVQAASNERSAAEAQAAAESGLEFVRYQLGRAVIPKDAYDANPLAAVADALGEQLNQSANNAGHRVCILNEAIEIPDDRGTIVLDPAIGTAFHARITREARSLRANIVGHGRGDLISRAIELDFRPEPCKPDGAGESIRLVPIADTYQEVSP